jgi:hypothetical protein
VTVIAARKTSYRGVLMRSRLEADYAAHLDRRGYEWEYEPIVFAGPAGQWLPDFRYRARGESESPTWYVEVKPVSHLDCQPGENYWARIERIDELLSRMAMTWLSEPDAIVVLDWWEYGRSESTASVFGYRSQPWLCNGDIPFAVAWPGMGQVQNWPPGTVITPQGEDGAA